MAEDFDKFVSFISKNIQSENKTQISEEEINDFINSLEQIIKNPHTVKIVGANITTTSLSAEYKDRLKKMLQTLFNINMRDCYIIKGDEQKKRDSTWWTEAKDEPRATNYWDVYKDGLKLAPKVKMTIDSDTDTILNNLFNPKEEDATSRYGMVVGHVQSGKTSNYAGLICKAADAGYRCFIVIAGIHNNLRNQTQKRIKDIFNTAKVKNENAPLFLTTDNYDFDKKDVAKFANLNFENYQKPIFLIIKKNTSTLKNVINWLNTRYPNKINTSLLLIDDEADNASINTKDENNPTVINKRIRELLSKFSHSAYVGYTATPFANIFIDDESKHDDCGKDLFPEDFIITLDAPDNYHGAEKIFLKNYNGVEIVEDFGDYTNKKDKKDFTMDELPPSLKEAIRCFYINIAIRHLRGQDTKHNSMMIHASRLTNGHKTIAYFVTEYKDYLTKEIQLYGLSKQNTSRMIQKIKDTFENKYDCEFSWEQILEKINSFYDTVKVIQEHSQSKDFIEYPDDCPQNIIAVGGNSLARGFTLEGLNVSYFTRSACASDTLMQMARWFGYRDNYEDICKIYMTEGIYQNFQSVAESTSDLVDSLNEMRKRGKTPKDFGLAVQKHPGTFLITARNKMKSTEEITREYSLDGFTKETNLLPSSEIDLDNNESVAKKLIDTLKKLKKPQVDSGKHLWADIQTNIIRSFFDKFKFAPDYGNFPVTSIKEYLIKYPNTLWNVLLYGTNKNDYKITEGIEIGTQERSVKPFEKIDGIIEIGSKSQVSGASAERYGLLKEELDEIIAQTGVPENKLTRSIIKKHMKNPLVMIHFVKNKRDLDDKRIYCALSFCFPLTGEIATTTVTLVANTVFMRQWKQMDLFGDDYFGEDNEE